ncbi:MAG: hypothetical protein ACRCWR_06985 [Saezia sp.]
MTVAFLGGGVSAQYNNAYLEALERTGSREEANEAGIGAMPAGVVEGLADKVLFGSLSKLMSTGKATEDLAAGFTSAAKSVHVPASVAVSIAGAALREGVAETGSEYIAGVGSTYATGRDYTKTGKELGLAFLGGVIGGGALTAGAHGVSTVLDYFKEGKEGVSVTGDKPGPLDITGKSAPKTDGTTTGLETEAVPVDTAKPVVKGTLSPALGSTLPVVEEVEVARIAPSTASTPTGATDSAAAEPVAPSPLTFAPAPVRPDAKAKPLTPIAVRLSDDEEIIVGKNQVFQVAGPDNIVAQTGFFVPAKVAERIEKERGNGVVFSNVKQSGKDYIFEGTFHRKDRTVKRNLLFQRDDSWGAREGNRLLSFDTGEFSAPIRERNAKKIKNRDFLQEVVTEHKEAFGAMLDLIDTSRIAVRNPASTLKQEIDLTTGPKKKDETDTDYAARRDERAKALLSKLKAPKFGRLKGESIPRDRFLDTLYGPVTPPDDAPPAPATTSLTKNQIRRIVDRVEKVRHYRASPKAGNSNPGDILPPDITREDALGDLFSELDGSPVTEAGLSDRLSKSGINFFKALSTTSKGKIRRISDKTKSDVVIDFDAGIIDINDATDSPFDPASEVARGAIGLAIKDLPLPYYDKKLATPDKFKSSRISALTKEEFIQGFLFDKDFLARYNISRQTADEIVVQMRDALSIDSKYNTAFRNLILGLDNDWAGKLRAYRLAAFDTTERDAADLKSVGNRIKERLKRVKRTEDDLFEGSESLRELLLSVNYKNLETVYDAEAYLDAVESFAGTRSESDQPFQRLDKQVYDAVIALQVKERIGYFNKQRKAFQDLVSALHGRTLKDLTLDDYPEGIDQFKADLTKSLESDEGHASSLLLKGALKQQEIEDRKDRYRAEISETADRIAAIGNWKSIAYAYNAASNSNNIQAIKEATETIISVSQDIYADNLAGLDIKDLRKIYYAISTLSEEGSLHGLQMIKQAMAQQGLKNPALEALGKGPSRSQPIWKAIKRKFGGGWLKPYELTRNIHQLKDSLSAYKEGKNAVSELTRRFNAVMGQLDGLTTSLDNQVQQTAVDSAKLDGKEHWNRDDSVRVGVISILSEHPADETLGEGLLHNLDKRLLTHLETLRLYPDRGEYQKEIQAIDGLLDQLGLPKDRAQFKAFSEANPDPDALGERFTQSVKDNLSVGQKNFYAKMKEWFNQYKDDMKFVSHFVHGKPFEALSNYVPTAVKSPDDSEYSNVDITEAASAHSETQKHGLLSKTAGIHDKSRAIKQGSLLTLDAGFLWQSRGRLHLYESNTAAERVRLDAALKDEEFMRTGLGMPEDTIQVIREIPARQQAAYLGRASGSSTSYVVLNTFIRRLTAIKLSGLHQFISQPTSAIMQHLSKVALTSRKAMPDFFALVGHRAKNSDLINRLNDQGFFNIFASREETVFGGLETAPLQEGYEKNKVEGFMRGAIGTQINQALDKISAVTTAGSRLGDKFIIYPILMSEYAQAWRKMNDDYLTPVEKIFEGGIYAGLLDTANREAARVVGTSGKTEAPGFYTTKETGISFLRNLLFAFKFHVFNQYHETSRALSDLITYGKSMTPDEIKTNAGIAASSIVGLTMFSVSSFYVTMLLRDAMFAMFGLGDEEIEKKQIALKKQIAILPDGAKKAQLLEEYAWLKSIHAQKTDKANTPVGYRILEDAVGQAFFWFPTFTGTNPLSVFVVDPLLEGHYKEARKQQIAELENLIDVADAQRKVELQVKLDNLRQTSFQRTTFVSRESFGLGANGSFATAGKDAYDILSAAKNSDVGFSTFLKSMGALGVGFPGMQDVAGVLRMRDEAYKAAEAEKKRRERDKEASK